MFDGARWKDIEDKPLFTGAGKDTDHACIMQMVSYVAGEPWSDQPVCACPILTQYAIRLNDRFNDEHRQRMKPFIPILVGTRSTDAIQIKRKQLIMWRNVTATYPLFLELFKLPELADALRIFQNTVPDVKKSAEILKENKEAIYKAAHAYAYADANAYANANAYAYADADAYADAYANAYAYADAYADANANAYAYADADAYADALREKLATVALDTLRMAIEVKE